MVNQVQRINTIGLKFDQYLNVLVLSTCLILSLLSNCLKPLSHIFLFCGSLIFAMLCGINIGSWFKSLRLTWIVCLTQVLSAFIKTHEPLMIISSFLMVLFYRLMIESVFNKLTALQFAGYVSAIIPISLRQIRTKLFFICIVLFRFPKIFSEQYNLKKQSRMPQLKYALNNSLSLIYNGICYLPKVHAHSGPSKLSSALGLLSCLGLIAVIFWIDWFILS